MRNFRLSLLCFMLITGLFAQNSEEPAALAFSDGYFTAGVLMANDHIADVSDFRQLFPEASLLQQDFSNYQNSTSYGTHRTSTFYGAMALQFLNKKTSEYQPNYQLRVGLGIRPVTGLGAFYYSEDRFRFDTLNSAAPVYVDSVYYNSTAMNYTAENVNLDVSFLIKTNPEHRWLFYSGLGISGGVSINSMVHIFQHRSSRFESTDLENYYNGRQQNFNERNIKRLDASFGGTVYVPLGVGYRLSEKHAFWKKVSLIAEGRPLLEWSQVEDLGTFANATFAANFGLKISN